MDPFAEPERLTVAEAFDRFAGIDLLASVAAGGAVDRQVLAQAAQAAGVRVADDDTWADVFSRVMVERIEPRLGLGRASILCEYPAAEAALARLSPRDPRVAERFELYACGVELANAFAELTDPVEQRRRLVAEMDEKARVYGERYPIDEDFLGALAAMPPACRRDGASGDRRTGHDGHADRAVDREHRPALERLFRNQGQVSARPRRLHL